MKEKILKPGTKVRILFRPLKKLCEKRGWEYIYCSFVDMKGKKHDLICSINNVFGTPYSESESEKEDGKYYELELSSWIVPSSCFRVIKKK